jgi:hypothetical protein
MYVIPLTITSWIWWIGHSGPISWLARSLDIKLCDLFLWAYVKDSVYTTVVAIINDLKTRISAAMEIVEVLQCTWGEIEHYFYILCVTNVCNVECV